MHEWISVEVNCGLEWNASKVLHICWVGNYSTQELKCMHEIALGVLWISVLNVVKMGIVKYKLVNLSYRTTAEFLEVLWDTKVHSWLFCLKIVIARQGLGGKSPMSYFKKISQHLMWCMVKLIHDLRWNRFFISFWIGVTDNRNCSTTYSENVLPHI
jgi:hypothetical protein